MPRIQSIDPTKPSQPEQHEFQFRGCWIPPRVFRLIQHQKQIIGRNGNKTIARPNTSDIAILMMIDALSNNERGGCFATNKYLAAQFDVQERAIERTLSRLTQFGLIKTSGNNRKRLLKTAWFDATESPGIPAKGDGISTPNTGQGGRPYSKNKELTNTSSLTRRRRLENKPMLINVEARTKTTPRYLPEDMISAAHLHDTVVHAGKRQAWSQVAWAKQFAALRNEVGFDRIELALDWIRKNIKKEYCPQAWSGKSFRAKFDQIEAAMNRDAERNPQVTISKEAKDLAFVLNRWEWPGNCQKELATAIQISIDRYEKFWRALKSIRKKTLISKDVMRPRFSSDVGALANQILSNLGSPDNFVDEWFTQIAPWAIKKKVGTLFPGLVFSVENQRFQKMLRTIAADYGDSDGLVDLLKEIDCVHP